MNSSLKDVIQGKCVFDIEKTPIIVGDIVSFTTTGSKSIYTAAVIKIDPSKQKLKVRHSIVGPKTWFEGKHVLNISKKYGIDAKKNAESVLEIENKIQTSSVQKALILGVATDQDNSISLFQLNVESKPGNKLTVKDIISQTKNYLAEYSNIQIFSKYCINLISLEQLTKISSISLAKKYNYLSDEDNHIMKHHTSTGKNIFIDIHSQKLLSFNNPLFYLTSTNIFIYAKNAICTLKDINFIT